MQASAFLPVIQNSSNKVFLASNIARLLFESEVLYCFQLVSQTTICMQGHDLGVYHVLQTHVCKRKFL